MSISETKKFSRLCTFKKSSAYIYILGYNRVHGQGILQLFNVIVFFCNVFPFSHLYVYVEGVGVRQVPHYLQAYSASRLSVNCTELMDSPPQASRPFPNSFSRSIKACSTSYSHDRFVIASHGRHFPLILRRFKVRLRNFGRPILLLLLSHESRFQNMHLTLQREDRHMHQLLPNHDRHTSCYCKIMTESSAIAES